MNTKIVLKAVFKAGCRHKPYENIMFNHSYVNSEGRRRVRTISETVRDVMDDKVIQFHDSDKVLGLSSKDDKIIHFDNGDKLLGPSSKGDKVINFDNEDKVLGPSSKDDKVIYFDLIMMIRF